MVFTRSAPAETQKCVLDAIAVGYRLIDTAQIYGNEEAVGSAINMWGSPREIVLTTKNSGSVIPDMKRHGRRLENSLSRLQTDYIDLMLIHQPFGDYYGAYRAMEEAYNEGWIRAIGVSNFYPDRLVDLCQFAEIPPAVNQVETHVFQQQREARSYMDKYHVQQEAWAPFAEGRAISSPIRFCWKSEINIGNQRHRSRFAI